VPSFLIARSGRWRVDAIAYSLCFGKFSIAATGQAAPNISRTDCAGMAAKVLMASALCCRAKSWDFTQYFRPRAWIARMPLKSCHGCLSSLRNFIFIISNMCNPLARASQAPKPSQKKTARL
jgi:hypothetical protein